MVARCSLTREQVSRLRSSLPVEGEDPWLRRTDLDRKSGRAWSFGDDTRYRILATFLIGGPEKGGQLQATEGINEEGISEDLRSQAGRRVKTIPS